MKYLFALVFFISAFSFAQNSGSISGKLIDSEAANTPLMFAKIKIKETGKELLSNENGFFKFEGLKDGTYTLVCSFVGYETKKLKTKVTTNKNTQVELALKASTISLDELVLTLADSETKSTASNNTSNQ